jgi:hypothetical protein
LNGAPFDTAALPPTQDIRPSRVTAFRDRVAREAIERLERFERVSVYKILGTGRFYHAACRSFNGKVAPFLPSKN